MVNLIYCEILKLKRSKMFLLSILGSFAAPGIILVGLIKAKIDDPTRLITFHDALFDANLYILNLFGAVVYVVMLAYLFNREFTEKTLKLILTVPVSKVKLIISKFILFYFWILVMTLISWLATVAFSFIGGADEFSFSVLTVSLKQFIFGASLLFISLTPFAFITILFKNIVPSIIAIAAVIMINVALFNESLAALFPWTSLYLIASNQIRDFPYPTYLSYLIIFVVSFLGFYATIIYFNKSDIK